jgi:hypothetical protein
VNDETKAVTMVVLPCLETLDARGWAVSGSVNVTTAACSGTRPLIVKVTMAGLASRRCWPSLPFSSTSTPGVSGAPLSVVGTLSGVTTTVMSSDTDPAGKAIVVTVPSALATSTTPPVAAETWASSAAAAAAAVASMSAPAMPLSNMGGKVDVSARKSGARSAPLTTSPL